MLYREIIAVCPQVHTKHTNTLCEQNAGCSVLQPTLHTITTACYNPMYLLFQNPEEALERHDSAQQTPIHFQVP